MVKFGERLPGMMRQGWEEYYINYEGLKSIIEAIELAPANQNQMSEDFLARATAEVSKVDSFVAREEKAIRKRLEQSVTITDVRKIEDALANLVRITLPAPQQLCTSCHSAPPAVLRCPGNK